MHVELGNVSHPTVQCNVRQRELCCKTWSLVYQLYQVYQVYLVYQYLVYLVCQVYLVYQYLVYRSYIFGCVSTKI